MHPSSQPQSIHAALVAIEWEETPSLAHLVGKSGAATAVDDHVWQETMPATLEDLVPAKWVHDRIDGLDVQETQEPEIFRLFFDAPHDAAHAATR